MHGAYGDDEEGASPGESAWTASMRPISHESEPTLLSEFLKKMERKWGKKGSEKYDAALVVDFEGKRIRTHDRYLYCGWDSSRRVLHWEDGNSWCQMYVHPSVAVSPRPPLPPLGGGRGGTGRRGRDAP